MENDDARSGDVPDVAIFDGTRDIRGTESLARSAVVWGAEGVGYVARCSGITGVLQDYRWREISNAWEVLQDVEIRLEMIQNW